MQDTLWNTQYVTPLERRNASLRQTVEEGKMSKQDTQILNFLKLHPNSTSRQISSGTHIDRTSVTRSLIGLVRGLYVDSTQETWDDSTHRMVSSYTAIL